MPAISTTDSCDTGTPGSVTQVMARFCVDTAAACEGEGRDRGALDAVLSRAQLCVADCLHAALLGAGSPTGDLLWDYVGGGGGGGGGLCTAVMRGASDPEAAALYNGAVAAVQEIDDVHFDTSMHPGAAVVPSALAAAEWEVGASGLRLLAAVAVGYEIAIRLSIAAGHRHYHFFHSAATCGAVGAAAAAAVAAGLTEIQTCNALGLAATMASGLWEGINSDAVMVKHLHLGLAAERGVRAARLARLGWPAATTAIEGPKGFLAGLARPGHHAPHENPANDDVMGILTCGLGSGEWAILRNIFKRYPFCLGCFEPIEGLKDILRRTTGKAPGDISGISGIVVEASPSVAWMVGQRDVHSELQAKFSAAYALALVLTGRGAEHVPMQQHALRDPEGTAMAAVD